jgi:hypothetical protein
VSTSQKGSIELVGEFFELKAQVDRDLTTVSRVNRRLGLIKNHGRHSKSLKMIDPTFANNIIYEIMLFCREWVILK